MSKYGDKIYIINNVAYRDYQMSDEYYNRGVYHCDVCSARINNECQAEKYIKNFKGCFANMLLIRLNGGV